MAGSGDRAASPSCSSSWVCDTGQASEGRRNKRLLRQVEINSYWANRGAGKKSSWQRAKTSPGELGHTWGGAGFARRDHPGGKWEGFLPLDFPVLGRVRRVSWTLRFGGWVSAGWGPGRAAVPGSLSWRWAGTHMPAPWVCPGATKGRDRAHTSAEEGVLISSRGTRATVWVSQYSTGRSLAAPDPGSAWELQITFFFFFGLNSLQKIFLRQIWTPATSRNLCPCGPQAVTLQK